MLIVILFLLVSAYYVLTDLMPVYKKKQWNVFWAYISILSLDFVMVLLLAMNVPLPSPSLPIKKIVTTIFGF